MSKKEGFIPAFESELSLDDRSKILARVSLNQINRFLMSVYMYTIEMGDEEVFEVDENFREKLGLDDWHTVNVARLLVADGFLEAYCVRGEEKTNRVYRYLKLTPLGRMYCEKNSLV